MDWQLKALLSLFLGAAVMVLWVPAQFVVGLNTFRLLKKGNTNSAFKWVSFYTVIAVLFMIFLITMDINYNSKPSPSNIIIPILTIALQIFIYKYFSRKFLL